MDKNDNVFGYFIMANKYGGTMTVRSYRNNKVYFDYYDDFYSNYCLFKKGSDGYNEVIQIISNTMLNFGAIKNFKFIEI